MNSVLFVTRAPSTKYEHIAEIAVGNDWESWESSAFTNAAKVIGWIFCDLEKPLWGNPLSQSDYACIVTDLLAKN